MEIRTATISFSRKLSKTTNSRAMAIQCQIDVLHDVICNNFHSPDIDQVLKEFDDLKTELQTIYSKKGEAAMFRSKCRWVEKYFFNLEKRNYNKKTISELRGEDETIIKNETQILDDIENYYNNLYTSAGSATQDEFDEYI